ncbi:STAS domain-containing protein [Streptomyces tsukubensis]|uniref:STAS domain-containing protein n=1 Tax=Streptomyces tsukubensis TaxID=83656 RepID=UPI001D053FFC|nr:STAS domain-containing protein [Streptomyces tsukubensis]
MPRPRTPGKDDHAGVPPQRSRGVLGDQYALENTWVIAAHGDIDMQNLGPLRMALEETAASHPVTVLDTSGVTFADSTFLNLLLRAHQSTSLRIAAPSEPVRRLLEITGADRVLSLYPSVAQAGRD